MPNSSKKLNVFTTKRIVFDALFVALYFVLSKFITIPTGNFFEITLKAFPIILCAFLFGPIDGLIVSFLGSFMEQFIMPEYGITPTFFIWMIPVVFRGVFIGFVANKVKFKPTIAVFIISIIVSSIIVAILNIGATYLDGLIMGYSVKAFTLTLGLLKLLNAIVSAIIYIAIVPPLFYSIKKIVFQKIK